VIQEALRALWEYRVRAILTLSILAFGITALVGILTSLEALRGFLAQSLGGLGTRAFSVSGGPARFTVQVGRKRFNPSQGQPLRSWEVEDFIQRYRYPQAQVSRSLLLAFGTQARYQNRKTPAQVRLFGVDPPYFAIQELSLEAGRSFTALEVDQAAPVIVLGWEVARQLFPASSPLGKWVQVGSHYYRVVGVVEKRGSLFGFNLDTECFLPWTTGRRWNPQASFTMVIGVPTVEEVPQAMQAARATLRLVRQLRPPQEDTFQLFRGEMLADFMLKQLQTIALATVGISLLTLLGATLSLTNILLVVVKERTQEIGLRMALGATRAAILRQFLFEAVVIALVGGAGGIVLGLLLGNGVAWLIGSRFVMPWKWVLIAVGLTGLVGIVAGFQPAREAARLSPVEALRYE